MATKVMDCDLVVLGAGGSGLVAAVKAADISGKKVIVLEKSKRAGGATNLAHGFSIRDSQWQKDAGETVSDTPDISGRFFDWLVTKGDIDKYVKMSKKGQGSGIGMGSITMPERLPRYKDHPDGSIGPGWWGTLIVDKMLECCEKMDIPVLTETRAKEFVTNDEGMVTGVLADTTDGQLLVNCKACFIGAGGFAGSREKREKMFPESFNNNRMHIFCPSSETGDCIDMAERVGVHVDLSKSYILIGGPAHHPYSYSIYRIMRQAEVLSLNLDCKRFMDETEELMGGYEALAKQPKGEMFAIADDDIVEMVQKRLIANPPEESDLPVFRKMREEIAYEVALDEAGAKGDHTKQANTLEELALKMRVDPVAFVKAVEKYNKYCETGKDPEFGKKAENLIPIKKPPFYAFWGQRFSETSHGGIAVNSENEVLNTRGEVVPGLFAGGDGTTIFGQSGGGGMSGPGAASGGAPGAAAGAGAQGGAPGAGASAGAASGGSPGGAQGGAPSGGMPGMGGSATETTNILEGPSTTGGGLGNAITSGYQGGISAGNYLKSL